MALHKFRIRSGPKPGQGSVEMDGSPVMGVLKFKVTGGVGEIPTVTLTMFSGEIDIETDVVMMEEESE